jgi:hypothetical protein
VKNSLPEEENEFINFLAFEDLKTEYKSKKKELFLTIERKYKQEDTSIRRKN